MPARPYRWRLSAAWSVGIPLLIASVAVSPASGGHSVFSFRVDRFEIDGNVNGSGNADGSADLIDEFDNGDLAPNWQVLWGTVAEHDGYVFLTNPGSHYAEADLWPDLVFDQSVVFTAFPLGDGLGDFVASSTWEADPVTINNYNCFLMLASGSTLIREIVGPCVSNLDPAVAAIIGYPSGLAISQAHLRVPQMGSPDWLPPQTISIQPEDVTGQIAFRIAFDDASNTVSTSISLDGGSTFQGFAAASLIDTGSSFLLQFNVDPVTLESEAPTATPAPPTATLVATPTATPTESITPTATPTPPSTLCPGTPRADCRTSLKRLLVLKRDATDPLKDKLVWKWTKGAATMQAELGDPRDTADYTLCVYDGTGASLLAIAVASDPVKWSASGPLGYTYRDGGGTVAGIHKIVLKAGAENKARAVVKGKGVDLPDPDLGALPLPVRAQLFNSETSVCFESAFDNGDVVKNDVAQFKAKVP